MNRIECAPNEGDVALEVEIGHEYLGPDPDGKMVRVRVDKRGGSSDRIPIKIRGHWVPSDVAIITFLQGEHKGRVGRASYLHLVALNG
jgi:hypothetical protein